MPSKLCETVQEANVVADILMCWAVRPSPSNGLRLLWRVPFPPAWFLPRLPNLVCSVKSGRTRRSPMLWPAALQVRAALGGRKRLKGVAAHAVSFLPEM